MAYTPSTLENVYSQIDGVWKIFRYISTDAIASVLGAGYITDYKAHGMGVGDLVFVIDQATPVLTVCKVNSVSGAAATLAVANTVTGTFTNLTVSGNVALGDAAADLVAMYGATASSQRAAAAQATSAVGTASSTAVDTNLKAAVIEIMNTLAQLGAWKGAA